VRKCFWRKFRTLKPNLARKGPENEAQQLSIDLILIFSLIIIVKDKKFNYYLTTMLRWGSTCGLKPFRTLTQQHFVQAQLTHKIAYYSTQSPSYEANVIEKDYYLQRAQRETKKLQEQLRSQTFYGKLINHIEQVCFKRPKYSWTTSLIRINDQQERGIDSTPMKKIEYVEINREIGLDTNALHDPSLEIYNYTVKGENSKPADHANQEYSK
jgi:hypothetical protein